MDYYFSLLTRLQEWTKKETTSTVAQWPECTSRSIRKEFTSLKPFTNGYTFTMLYEDTRYISRKLMWCLSRICPNITHTKSWHSTDEAISRMQTMFPLITPVSFSESSEFAAMSLPARLSWICKYGIGAHLLKPSRQYKDTLCIDLHHLSQYAVRSPFLRYGACLYVNAKTFEPTFIECGNMVEYPATSQFAYNVFMASLIAHVTIVDHAVNTHYVWSGGVNSATLTHLVPSVFTRPCDQHLVNFMRVFLFRTSEVNTNAVATLTNYGGIASRVFAFTNGGLTRLMQDAFTMQQGCMCPDLDIEHLETFFHPSTPVYHDARLFLTELWIFVRAFINLIPRPFQTPYLEFMQDIRKDDNIQVDTESEQLVRILVQHIFMVSFWHEHVGNMSRYIMDPGAGCTKIHKHDVESTQMNMQDSHQAIWLIANTSVIPMFKLTDVDTNVLARSGPTFQHVWTTFQARLEMIQPKFLCKHYQPKFLERSVSL